MKRIKIAAAILCIVFLWAVGSLFVLKYQNAQLKERVERIQQVYESGDTEQALMLSNELNEFWHKYEKNVTTLIHDDVLNSLNISIARITPFIANENDELIAEIQSVYHQIDQIYEEEFPSLHNIL